MVNILTLTEYQKMLQYIAAWQKQNRTTRLPNYVDIAGHRVTKAQYQDMMKRVENWKITHQGQLPAEIGIEGPIMSVSKTAPSYGVLQKKLIDAVGYFTTFTEFYVLCKARGYLHYVNDIYDQITAIARLKNRAGLNCSDISQIGYFLAKEMGYKVAFEHIVCKSGVGHIILRIDGKEFGDHGNDPFAWKRVDLAARISVGSQYALGNIWCSDGRHLSFNDSWLMTDDGRT